MEKFAQATPELPANPRIGQEKEVTPERTGLCQVKIRHFHLKLLLIVGLLLIGFGQMQAQTYKFSKCENHHFILDKGYTVDEIIIEDVKVTITNDSIIFTKPVISATKLTRFKIERKSEYTRFGLGGLAIWVEDMRTRTVITILIDDKMVSPEDPTIVKRLSTQFDQ